VRRYVLKDQLRRKLREEIELSEAIVAKGADVVPRFRVLTPDGEYQILVQMKENDPVDRLARLKLVAGFTPSSADNTGGRFLF
jgi:hypothetical protein